ncbi:MULTISPECIES: hypothetical protein [Bacillus cereus group]|uniref:Phr family secreted Rap phosphatase inhibitor n=1 Tax=Bacillus cytotoxicus TaxID=580165 RepID=A0AAX2CGF7_9BACI|nr:MULTISPECIES: hypothetical protein [Bacillus cereus group]MDH2864245.1 hypothetical protein [Bacillus cytotoxicus]MDH2885213.1 hypothetical protein [Bacillus cytotoxicus]NZD32871.1 hypothetical protein [Bacillus cytotoxicus]QTR72757.1 hypothetical protein JC775_09525 [Bacillus cytotoxicus]QTR77921.1 hypothetical protein JC773_15430 [Bacillus cytotoxicus]
MKKTFKFFGISVGLTLLLVGFISDTPSNTLQAEHGKTFMQKSSISQYELKEHGKTF